MNKIAHYLNSNLVGEVLTTPMIRLNYSRDRSVLRLIPNSVALPRNTDDIRKIAKLAWQLGEKGRPLALTARGRGHSQTGAAIGKDIIIDFNRHLNKIIDIDPNQGLIHVQAGIEMSQILAVAQSHGLSLPFEANPRQTIGGVLSSNNAELDLEKIKDLSQAIDQLEVVLANGDVIQTRRISKRELSKKLGQPGLEGDIYRQIDQLIEENSAILNKIDTERIDNTGYHSLALVKQKDGSFDLSPLFIGAQGTLGLITEAIIKLDILSPKKIVIAASFLSIEDALDAQEGIIKLHPSCCNIYHANILSGAIENGKQFSFYDQAFENFAQAPAVCLTANFNLKNRPHHKIISKKIEQIVKSKKGFVVISDDKNLAQLEAIKDTPLLFSNINDDLQNIPLINGIQVPITYFREFITRLNGVAELLNINLPYYGSCTSGIINIQTELNLKLVSDKQKVFRLLSAITKLAKDNNSTICAGEGEGRLKAPFAYQLLDPKLREIFTRLRRVFDAQAVLNPGVKESVPLKDLISATVNDYYNGIFY